jgi:hypothetical protein
VNWSASCAAPQSSEGSSDDKLWPRAKEEELEREFG